MDSEQGDSVWHLVTRQRLLLCDEEKQQFFKRLNPYFIQLFTTLII